MLLRCTFFSFLKPEFWYHFLIFMISSSLCRFFYFVISDNGLWAILISSRCVFNGCLFNSNIEDILINNLLLILSKFAIFESSCRKP